MTYIDLEANSKIGQMSDSSLFNYLFYCVWAAIKSNELMLIGRLKCNAGRQRMREREWHQLIPKPRRSAESRWRQPSQRTHRPEIAAAATRQTGENRRR